ncbi:MAG: hypothetical protein IJO43_04180 [Bacilli bacterium]|nr:hypothetical protein [Bacilli bacterium]
MTKNNKEKVVKKKAVKQKVVKEKETIKKSDFEDSNDNKKIIIVALILALLIGTFAYVRSLDNKKENKKPEEDVVEKEEEKEEENKPVVEEEVTKPNYYNPTPTPIPSEPVVEVDIWESLKTIPTTIEAGEGLELPEIKDEDNASEVVAEISYKYRSSSEEDYSVVTEFDSTKQGEYVITYTLSYSDGTVETREVVIEVIDTMEPVINNPEAGKHYKEDVLLDIIEYSPYIVELNGNIYDETLPISDEGEYVLVVTEDKMLGSSITVEFVIDKTAPEIVFAEVLEGTKVSVIEKNIDTITMFKDGVEIELLATLVEDGEYKVVVTDKAGNIAEKTIIIDTIAPEVEVEYTPGNDQLTSDKVVVVITANEEIQEIEGWTLSEDKLTLTKEFKENATELVEVKDIAGNVTEVNVVVNNIDYSVVYTPKLTIENLVANQVKATITSLKQLTLDEEFKDEWSETYDEENEVYKYEKIYTEAKEELIEYTYEDENGNPVAGEIKVEISGVTIIDTMVIYETDDLTQNVTVSVITDEEIITLPEGWVRDDNYMASDYKYYKVYTENVEEELVEFISENKTYIATITVSSIDREAPVAESEVNYEEEKSSVTITINSNEEIITVEGWVLSTDKKSISKKIDRPSEVTEEVINDTVTITDLKGNETEVEYSYTWEIE